MAAIVENRKRVIIDEEFNVMEDQREDDEEMTKDAVHELGESPTEKGFSTRQSLLSPPKPGIPERSSSRSSKEPANENTSVVTTSPATMEQLQADYADTAKYRIFQLAGDDLTGRPVIAFSACRLPKRNLIDHQKLFSFLKGTLDQYVENDYTIVYFHYGLNSQNKPSLKWLLQLYRELDRKYKKNLKALYIVHPSNFIKTVFNMFYPFISKKFGRKINNIRRLDELAPHIRLDQLDIPKDVMEHDEKVAARLKSTSTLSVFHAKIDKPKTQQFGVPLQELKDRSGQTIPIVVQSSIDFLEKNALDVEGIFRRSAQASSVTLTAQRYNQGEAVTYTVDDVHLASAILKKFLRDIPEPLLTFGLYDRIMDSCALSEEERLHSSRTMILKDLPECNREVLQYLLQFLQKVVEHSSSNRMTAASLAIVFGPNLLWSKNETSTLTSMSKVNSYTKYLIENSHVIFDESFF